MGKGSKLAQSVLKKLLRFKSRDKSDLSGWSMMAVRAHGVGVDGVRLSAPRLKNNSFGLSFLFSDDFLTIGENLDIATDAGL